MTLITERHYNNAPADLDPSINLPQGFMDFVLPLHKKLTSRQQEFISRRAERLAASDPGSEPGSLAPSDATSKTFGKPVYSSKQTSKHTQLLTKHLSGVMTFFFSIIYLQYHINRIHRWKNTGILS